MWKLPVLPFAKLIVPMFFALSGFLVGASFERTKTLGMFYGLRAVRIFPALAFDTIVSALILGPVFTQFSLSAYFSDPLFIRYWLNILGEPQFSLPGVFLDHPVSGIVKSQLWTIPLELGCYLSIGAIGLLGGQKRLWVAPVAALVATIVYPAMQAIKQQELLVDSRMSGMLIVACFLWGVTFYQHRNRVTGSIWSAIVSVVLGMVLMSLHVGGGIFGCAAPFFLAHATAVVGCLNPKPSRFSSYADYSYGLYLYGFPMQQVLVHFSWIPREPVTNFVLAVGLSGVMAAISWKYVEKPALKLRPMLKDLEKRWLERQASKAPAAAHGAMAGE